jgi:uncharacterized protein
MATTPHASADGGRAESLASAHRRGLASGSAAASGDNPRFLADRVLLAGAWRVSCADSAGQSEDAQLEFFIAWVHGYVVRAEQLEDAAWMEGTWTPEAARAGVPLPERFSQLHAATGAVERVLVRYRGIGGVIRREEVMKTDRAMTQATEAGDVALVAELIALSPDLINRFSPLGWTPLHVAAHAGQGPLVEFLLTHGAAADAPAKNDLRSTPLLRAVMAGHTEIVVLLLAHGANVNIANSAGATPLHKAAIHGDRHLVRLLLDHGGRTDARNSGGQTPLNHAQHHGDAEIIAMLRQEAPEAGQTRLVPHG